MKSKAAIAGHPIHPMLVPIPIGLVVWTFIADIIYILGDQDLTWYNIAFYSGIAAWVSALVAALPGFVDFAALAHKTDSKNMATAHMVINVTMVVLFAVSTLLMWDEGALSDGEFGIVLALHGIGAGILAVSGWIGGEMVYRGHLAMIPDTIDLEQGENRRHMEPSGQVDRPVREPRI